MSTPHYATPAEWKLVEDRASLVSSDSCLMELCARVEALERRAIREPMEAAPGVAIKPPELSDEEVVELWQGPGFEESLHLVRRIHRAGWDAAMAAVAQQQQHHRQEPAPCPHIRSSDEGSSYCALAEQPTPNPSQIGSSVPAVSLMEAVEQSLDPYRHRVSSHDDIITIAGSWDPQARAVIRAAADWLDVHFADHYGHGDQFASRLRQEVEQ